MGSIPVGSTINKDTLIGVFIYGTFDATIAHRSVVYDGQSLTIQDHRSKLCLRRCFCPRVPKYGIAVWLSRFNVLLLISF